MTDVRLCWDLGADLGEGPLWDSRDGALWFTDIKQRKVHRFDPRTGEKASWDSPDLVGFVVPARSGGFIAGLGDGLYRFDPSTGEFELVVEVEADRPGNRPNDGVVDCAGRLWFGTMACDERTRSGGFYCFFEGRLGETGISGIAITNGPAVSPDGSTLYWVDTLARKLFAAPILGDFELAPSRLVVEIESKGGHPDGPTVDSAGDILIALYGGWAARRYSPGGDLLQTVRFPVANITKLAFGGDDLRTAYATSARHLLAHEDLDKQPLAGGLFEFRVPARGIASAAVADLPAG